MTRQIAFLRAINITGRSVKMDRLRALFTEMGLANVATFIASGNVLFDADGATETLEQRIEAHLQDALGFEVATFLRSADEVAAVAAHQPFAAEELAAAFGLMIAFLKRPPDDAATAPAAAATTRPDPPPQPRESPCHRLSYQRPPTADHRPLTY